MSCEYCKNKKLLGESNDEFEGIDVGIVENKLIVSGWYDSIVGIEPLYIAINFCPHCGSKLGDSDD